MNKEIRSKVSMTIISIARKLLQSFERGKFSHQLDSFKLTKKILLKKREAHPIFSNFQD